MESGHCLDTGCLPQGVSQMKSRTANSMILTQVGKKTLPPCTVALFTLRLYESEERKQRANRALTHCVGCGIMNYIGRLKYTRNEPCIRAVIEPTRKMIHEDFLGFRRAVESPSWSLGFDRRQTIPLAAAPSLGASTVLPRYHGKCSLVIHTRFFHPGSEVGSEF